MSRRARRSGSGRNTARPTGDRFQKSGHVGHQADLVDNHVASGPADRCQESAACRSERQPRITQPRRPGWSRFGIVGCPGLDP